MDVGEERVERRRREMQRRRKRSKRIGIRSLGSLYGRMRFEFRVVVVVVVESCKKSGLLNHARCKFWHRVQRCTKLDKRIKWQQCHTAHAARERKKETVRERERNCVVAKELWQQSSSSRTSARCRAIQFVGDPNLSNGSAFSSAFAKITTTTAAETTNWP